MIKWRKQPALQHSKKSVEFERIVLPHLDAAHNLARWLTRDENQAQDAVQEAYLRAFSSFDSFHGSDGRPWILTIVRNACYTLLRKGRNLRSAEVLDEMAHAAPAHVADPELMHLKNVTQHALLKALEQLPAEFREVLVLREFEDMSYREIAQTVELPIGTVMSRLSRARQRLQTILIGAQTEGAA